jgi:poly-D-alanine transfer protein DltD
LGYDVSQINKNIRWSIFKMITLASAIEIVEQLPTDQQDMLVQIIRDRQIERRREEIAQNYLVSVSEEKSGKLTFTTDIEEIQKLQAELEASDRYEVSVTNNEIIFKKISPNVLTWEELSQRIDASGEDPDQPSLQEISEIVKDVRKSRKAEIA